MLYFSLFRSLALVSFFLSSARSFCHFRFGCRETRRLVTDHFYSLLNTGICFTSISLHKKTDGGYTGLHILEQLVTGRRKTIALKQVRRDVSVNSVIMTEMQSWRKDTDTMGL
jgi:hypothetical protein